MRINTSIKMLLSLIIIFSSLPALGMAEAPATEKQRIRHMIDFDYWVFGDSVNLTTYKISYDTGLVKRADYRFTDDSLLPQVRNGYLHNGIASAVEDTPSGLKGYGLIDLINKSKQRVVVIYEFDYATLSLRKVREFSLNQNQDAHLYSRVGLYSIESKGSSAEFYSLSDNKPVFTGGVMLGSYQVGMTEYSMEPFPEGRNYIVYCSDANLKDCYQLKFGGDRGKNIKVTVNKAKYDAAEKIRTRTFTAGGVKVTLEENRRFNPSKWKVTAIKDGQTSVFFEGYASNIKAFASPHEKNLLLTVETNKGKKLESSVVHMISLEKFQWLKKYKSPYNKEMTGVTWVSDDLYVGEHNIDIISDYPMYFTSFSSLSSIRAEYDPYLDEFMYAGWTTFSNDDLFIVAVPVAIKAGRIVLESKEQNAFYLNEQYYVPLKEFSEAFHIDYSVGKENISFSRYERRASLSMKGNEVIRRGNNLYLPLGTWNEDLGLEVSETKDPSYTLFFNKLNMEVTLIDKEKEQSDGVSEEVNSIEKEVRMLKRANPEAPFEEAADVTISRYGALVTLEHNKRLSIEGYNLHFKDQTMMIEVYTTDLKKLLAKIPVDVGWGKFDVRMLAPFIEDSATIIIPYKENLYEAITVHYQPFDKEVF
ncbi:hypothetical protein [Paenibacillus sp. KS-LC4]|uniref:hypothetical protein n=1 Tax=Paenibacillus sp. KS-LC4 TaxID=2979727 RepID=UPI0030CF0044